MTDTLAHQILSALDDIQAQHIIRIDVRSVTSITDDMIVCTGRSRRHLKSIANALKDKLGAAYPISLDGMDSDEWILVDAKDVIVHVMSAEARSFYRLESLWGKDTEDTEETDD